MGQELGDDIPFPFNEDMPLDPREDHVAGK
jgi:hypothetical protein